MSEVCFVKNISGKSVPQKDMEPPRYNGNDGYYFKRDETKALSRSEAEFLCRNFREFKLVGTHGEKGESIPENVLGTAKALETFGIGREDEPPVAPPVEPPAAPPVMPPKK